MADLPPFLIAERDALLAEIHEVFNGVSREGGVSWSESWCIDMNLNDNECAAARAQDQEVRWQDLLGNTEWWPDTASGG